MAKRYDPNYLAEQVRTDLAMAVMMGNLYAALREAGVSDAHAQRAAEEMAVVTDVTDLKGDVARLKADVSEIKTDLRTVKADVTSTKSDIALFKWMMDFTLALVVAVFGKLFVGSH